MKVQLRSAYPACFAALLSDVLAGLLPPLQPELTGSLPFLLGKIVTIPKELSSEAAQGLRGVLARLSIFMRQALQHPLNTMCILVFLPPGSPLAIAVAKVLIGEHK